MFILEKKKKQNSWRVEHFILKELDNWKHKIVKELIYESLSHVADFSSRT